LIVLEQIERIILPEAQWQELLSHCKRKLAGDYLAGETQYPRAYGMIAGRQEGPELQVNLILPVKKNARRLEPFKSYMDKILTEHAIPSTTPLSERAWITDPLELKECYDRCDNEDMIIVGTYHSHIVAWKHDAKRDTPTKLDTILAASSNFYQFIISMVDIDRPIIRAFFEGEKSKETPVIIR